MPTFKIIRGLPGSGKSTYAKLCSNFCIDLDDLYTTDGIYHWNRADIPKTLEVVDKILKEMMKLKCDIVISDVFPKISDFSHYVELAESNGYKVEIIKLTNNFGDRHNVDPKDLERMKRDWEEE